MTLKDFNDALMQKGQWLPLDPPDDGRATIGGVVATGLGGAQQFGYGPPRRHVIGMKVVLADGSLIKVGGRVVKNVAGYDLCKLFTGSYGTLGVIVEVNFKLRPVPFETRTVTAWGQWSDLISGARRILDSRLFPVAVEVLSPALANEAELSYEKDHFLLVRFAGSQGEVVVQTMQAIELLQNTNYREPECLKGDDSTLWQSLAALPLRFQKDLLWRGGFRPAQAEHFVAIYKGTCAAQAHEPRWQVGLGHGRVRVVDRITNGPDEMAEKRVRQSIDRVEGLSETAQSMGASLIIEHAPPEIRNRVKILKTLNGADVIMQRIKQQLDPDGVFPSL